jgi:hypothetical protein
VSGLFRVAAVSVLHLLAFRAGAYGWHRVCMRYPPRSIWFGVLFSIHPIPPSSQSILPLLFWSWRSFDHFKHYSPTSTPPIFHPLTFSHSRFPRFPRCCSCNLFCVVGSHIVSAFVLLYSTFFSCGENSSCQCFFMSSTAVVRIVMMLGFDLDMTANANFEQTQSMFFL